MIKNSCKIIFDARISQRTNITGVERVVQELIKIFKLLYPEKFEYKTPLFNNKIYQNVWVQILLPFYCWKNKHRIIFSPANNAPIMLANSVKLVSIIHDLSHLYYPAAYNYLFRLYYNYIIPKIIFRSDVIFTVSSSELEKIVEYYPSCKNKIYYFYNGISNEFYEKANIEIKKGILYVGSLSKRKNIGGVLKAFSLICSEIQDNLFIVGNRGENFSNDPEIQLLILSIPQSRIHFLGSINNASELCEIYNKMRIFVFPSFYESFGLPVLEAMKCGTPVVVSNIPALKEITAGIALYCEPNDAGDIAKNILLLYHDTMLYEKLRRNGIERSNEFTWEKSAKKIMSTLLEHHL